MGENIGILIGSIHLGSQVSLRSGCRIGVGRVRFETVSWFNEVELPSYIMSIRTIFARGSFTCTSHCKYLLISLVLLPQGFSRLF